MWNISAWLDDAENTPPVRTRAAKRARDDDDDPDSSHSLRKRSCLGGLDANSIGSRIGIDMPNRTPSPSKRRPLRSRQPSYPTDADETAMATPVARPSQRRPTEPENRFATQLPPPTDDDLRSHYSASSHSTKPSTTRSKSPIKDAVDLRLADIPIRYCRKRPGDLPECVDGLCKELEAIAEGDELVPDGIWAQMNSYLQQRGLKQLKARHKAPADAQRDVSSDDEHDLRQLCDILQDALREEDNNTSEPSWNAEVHAPVLRVALRPYQEYLYFHNITTARPVPAWLPTREMQASESRLVDYSINLAPNTSERAVVDTFLKRQRYSHATITQTMYAAVRERPCIASIETKTVSESDKAKNQLAVWGAAHLARVREFAVEGKDAPLFVHPLIHVQGHSWRIYFAVASPQTNAVDIVNATLALGATDGLLDLWKLVMSLRCLARWAQGTFRPAFFDCVGRSNYEC